ncbi:MAG: 23S rRNA pseudouridine(955/2504/2580) synthase RluC [Pseudomonadota bacterium]|nr:23S rRNA pseudouridine(955/2504/2580) synthase RluC [Pseudomonadota bacterium]
MTDSQKNSPPSKVRFVDIDDDREGQRVDNFLTSQLKGVPKSLIYRILRKGEVRVNKGRVKPEYKLRVGDVVRVPPVRLPEAKEQAKPSQQLADLIEASILYEDKKLIIVNKPSGLAVHGGSGINLGLIETMRQIRPQEKSLELVHRLDRDTSGCIMIAKRRSMLRYLHEQLREGRIQKIYHALVYGRWPNRKKEVNAPLKKNELQSGERMVRVDPEGKASRTLFRVLNRYSDCTLIEAKPVTGRTHQIRVHAQHAGHGLVGDPKYGNDDFNRQMKGKGFNRLFLHAAALELIHPDTSEQLRVEAPLDDRLERALKQLGREQ